MKEAVIVASSSDQAVVDFFRTFDEEARVLPLANRARLRAEIADHLAAVGEDNDDAVESALRRLGPPRQIVQSELALVSSPSGAHHGEGARLLLLVVGVLASVWAAVGFLYLILQIFVSLPGWTVIGAVVGTIAAVVIAFFALRPAFRRRHLRISEEKSLRSVA